MNTLLLGGDIGGTKTLLALASVGGAGIAILHEQRYASCEHEGLAPCWTTSWRAAPYRRRPALAWPGPPMGRRQT
ncbi:MAG: hypothetical protein IPJ73_04365 [Zoogloea sp.]|jgi:glucokinase|nr:hypothetical protein [Zoogloea sp.]